MGVAKSRSGVLQAWDYSSGESVGVLAVQNVLLLQILSGQSQKVYRDNRLGAQTPIHRSSNNRQPSSHWLLFNVTIHNPYPTWFPHKRRKAVLALLLTCGFTRNYQVTQLVPLLRTHSVPPTHDLPLKVSHVSQVFLQQLAKPPVT